MRLHQAVLWHGEEHVEDLCGGADTAGVMWSRVWMLAFPAFAVPFQLGAGSADVVGASSASMRWPSERSRGGGGHLNFEAAVLGGEYSRG